MEHNFTPQFQLFELLQHIKSGKMFVVTEVRYIAKKNLLGQTKGYEFEYNGVLESSLQRVMTAYEAWEKGMLNDPKLFVPKS